MKIVSSWVLIICYLFFFTCLVKAQSFSGIPFIQTFGTSDYQAGIQNWDIEQDSRGILYFANNFGLLEYDGHHWKTYPVKTGSKVRCLKIGVDGKIYIGVQGDFGYFVPSENGNWIYTSLAKLLPQQDRNFDETWRIYEHQGNIYFCTFKNIYRYDGNNIQTISPPHALEFSFLANNRLYVLDWERGLTSLEGDALIPVSNGDYFIHKRIVSILPYDQNQLLIVTQKHGLFIYDGHQLKPVNSQFQTPYLNSLITRAIRLKNGTFVVGSQSNGIFLLNHKLELLQHIDKQHGLNDHTIISMFEDRHQNLWIGHNHGISYVELSSPFTLLDEKVEVPGSGYAADLYHDTLYLGTNNGLYAGSINNWKDPHFQKVKNSEGQVYHISRQGDELLVGHHSGAFRVKDRIATPLSRRTGSWKFLRLHKKPELMLEGGYHGFSLYQLNNSEWNWKHTFAGFDESSRIFEEDETGNIWMAHGYKGIFRLQLDHSKRQLELVRFYGKEDGLPSDVLNNVYKINNELLFTGETGIFRYSSDEDKFYPDTSLINVFGKHEHIQKLQQDSHGRIYFLGNTKAGIIKKNSNGVWEEDISRFNKVRKLLNDDLDFLSVLDNQNVLLGAKEGFIHFNPTLPPSMPAPFQVYIRSVEMNTPKDSLLFGGNFSLNNKVISHQPKENIKQLPYESNSIRFQFSSPYFDGSEHLTYQYMLENFDRDWSN